MATQYEWERFRKKFVFFKNTVNKQNRPEKFIHASLDKSHESQMRAYLCGSSAEHLTRAIMFALQFEDADYFLCFFFLPWKAIIVRFPSICE